MHNDNITNAKGIAVLIGVSDKRVYQLVHEGVLFRNEQGKYDVRKSIEAYTHYKNERRTTKEQLLKKELKKKYYNEGYSAGYEEGLKANKRKALAEVNDILTEGVVCKSCGERWPVTAFNIKRIHDGCLFCRSSKLSRFETLEKECLTCKEIKDLKAFNFHKAGKKGRAAHCKACANADKDRRRKALLRSRRNTPKARINKRMSEMIRRAIGVNKQGRNWLSFVDYTLDDLKAHIEQQFTQGMNWDKFLEGQIHIDHIVPQSAFNFKTPDDLEFKMCWDLKNLQPLWASDNISKSNTKIYRVSDGARGVEVLL